MKILIVRNYPSYMDVEKNTYNIQEVGLAKALTRRGHKCDILFWTDKDENRVQLSIENTSERITVYYKKGVTFLKNTLYTGCSSLYRQYDVIQSCEYNQIQSWILAKRYSGKLIVYHGPYYSPFNKRYNLMCKFFDAFFLSRYLKEGTHFIVKSDLAKQFLVSKGMDPSRVITVGVGMDSQMLSTNAVNHELIYEHMSQHPEKIKLLYVGRLEKRRNVAFILNVLYLLKKKGLNVQLYVIGTGDEVYKSKLISKTVELELTNNIIWQDSIEQKYLSDIYKMADFFLLPTEYEIFGMVLLEAMYYGTIIVSTPNGGTNTVIRNNENGVIPTKLDAAEWSDTIYNLTGFPDECSKIKNEASQTIKEKYTWDKLADRFIREYEKKLNDGYIK